MNAYIWKSAKLEGLDVSYSDTEAIVTGEHAPSIRIDDIIAVHDLHIAWQYLLSHLDETANLPFIQCLHRTVGGNNLIENAGFIRKVPVSIGDTSWKPDMPIESQIKEEIADVLSIEEPTERAITLMLYLMRKQMFLDGNKRTSMLVGNQIMIAGGCGIISVPIEIQPVFTKMLVAYYESGDMTELKNYVYENCIDGIDFRQNEALSEEEQDTSEDNDSPTMTM